MLNSKAEIQTALEDMAEAFKEDTGIELEVQACGTGESPYTRITSAYNSGTAPTMAIIDATDVVALASQYAVDLSDEEWVKECVNQTTQVDGKIYSFPLCVEGRGIIYNKTAIEDTLGEEFDPSTINSYDALKELLVHATGAIAWFYMLQLILQKSNFGRYGFLRVLANNSMTIYLFHQQLIYISIVCLNGKINPWMHTQVNFMFSLIMSLLISVFLKKNKYIRFLLGEK